jgi:SpoVK/Ycf46/Vps4 family AAA+-type ATPase
VELPNDEIREAYIRHKLTDKDIENVDVKEWVKRTEGMSLSHLKEVVISTIVMGREFEDVMDNLEGLKKAPSIKGSGKVGFGQ